MSNSLQPHILHHARLPSPSLFPRVCSNSHLLSQWRYPTISSFVAPFSCPQSFPASGSFSNESALPIRWYWSFSPMNIQRISFKTDWFDLLAVQITLKSLLQHHSLKTSILAFFTVKLSHPYITTGKTITLAIRTFVGKVMSLLFNMLSRFVTAFLPRSMHLLISWL